MKIFIFGALLILSVKGQQPPLQSPGPRPPRPTGLPPRPPRPTGLPPRPPRPSGLPQRPPRPSGRPPRPPRPEEECCLEKMVGGIIYYLSSEWDTSGTGCLSDCIYQREEDPNLFFCFKPGQQETQCLMEDFGDDNTPNPAAAFEGEISIEQAWSQEPNGAERTALISVPASVSGQKFPVVFDLHGNGGQGNLMRLSRWLGEDTIIVAPNGYERSWNVYNENSKAPDVEFIKLLIQKVGEDFPAADTSDVTLLGTSNGAALIYRLLIDMPAPYPFKRVIPTVSSLFDKQFNSGSFWKATCGDCEDTSVLDIPVNVTGPGPEFMHFHGTDDGAVPYLGGRGVLGPDNPFLNAQDSTFHFAQAFGYTGAQLMDSEGVEVVDGMFRYAYPDVSVSHYKLVGAGHNAFAMPFRPDVEDIIRSAILGL